MATLKQLAEHDEVLNDIKLDSYGYFLTAFCLM